MKVNVLGCGPAGLLAAHEIVRAGHEVVIHSIKVPSEIKGAQFIHAPVPGITDDTPAIGIEFQNWGYESVYAEKVYGDDTAETSWSSFEGQTVPAWSMVDIYQQLWDLYERYIVDTEVRAPYIAELTVTDPAPCFSTITPLGYCIHPDQHEFVWQDVWISEYSEIPKGEDNVIVYNGNRDQPWYRSSRIMGIEATEFGHSIPEIPKRSRKPLSTDCDCFVNQPNFHRIGRFGEFRKTLLVSDAMLKVRQEMEKINAAL